MSTTNVSDRWQRSSFWPALFVVAALCASGLAQPSQSKFTINGVRFNVPKGFKLKAQQERTDLAYFRGQDSELGLFVAVPERAVDAEYLQGLARLTASYLYPNEKGLSWKLVPKENGSIGSSKGSRFEVESSMVQGFNGHQRIVAQLRHLRVKGKEIVIGYVFGLDRMPEDAQLFEENLAGDSLPGRDAQGRVIVSITGENFDELTPRIELIQELEGSSGPN